MIIQMLSQRGPCSCIDTFLTVSSTAAASLQIRATNLDQLHVRCIIRRSSECQSVTHAAKKAAKMPEVPAGLLQQTNVSKHVRVWMSQQVRLSQQACLSQQARLSQQASPSQQARLSQLMLLFGKMMHFCTLAK